MEKIICNKIKCLCCNDVIESTSVHEYVTCSCGKCSVDGGKHYLKRSFPSYPAEKWYKELSVYIDEHGVIHDND